MKKSIIIISIALSALGLTAFGLISWSHSESSTCCAPVTSCYTDAVCNTEAAGVQNETDFVFMVQSRFLSTVTTETLASAETILDIVPEPWDISTIESYYNIEVSTFRDDDRGLEVMKRGESEVLTDEQKRLIQSMDNSTSLFIVGNIMRTDGIDGKLRSDTLIYYMSVTPHYEAEYLDGQRELISYLKRNSKNVIDDSPQDQLAPGKIEFVVSRDGKVEDVSLGYSCGFSSIDNRMLEVVKDIPGKWKVATNAMGEKIEQKLTFFFGNQGC